MVDAKTIEADNTALVQSQALVAVFFSTGGIVHQTLRALAKASATGSGKGYRAYIIGRKAGPAETIIADCATIFPQGQITFVKADNLALIHDIDEACKAVIKLEEERNDDPRIDYLMLGQGGSIFLPRTDTSEGLDTTMSLMYYSRARVILQTLPLLLNSKLPTGATIVSVYAASMEKKLFEDDLSLRDPTHYTYSQARSHMCYMHTLFFESLARNHPGKLSLIHIFPGLVLGPGFQNPELPIWFRFIFNYIAMPLLGRFVTVKPEVCGQRMLSLASARYPASSTPGAQTPVIPSTDGSNPGSYCLNAECENSYPAKIYAAIDKDALRKKIWSHTTGAFSVIETGKPFKD